MEYNVLHTLQSLRVQGGTFSFYVNQYALGNELLKNSRKVKPDTIRTAFLFGLELEMHVELLKRDKNDEIDTLELCIAAAWEIHVKPMCRDRWCITYMAMEEWWSLSRIWWELERVGVRAEGGAPMELDALRYTEYVTSPLQWNVQFDRHPTEGGAVFRR